MFVYIFSLGWIFIFANACGSPFGGLMELCLTRCFHARVKVCSRGVGVDILEVVFEKMCLFVLLCVSWLSS